MCFSGVVNCILKMAERLRFTMRNCQSREWWLQSNNLQKIQQSEVLHLKYIFTANFFPCKRHSFEMNIIHPKICFTQNLITTHVFNMANLCVVVDFVNMKKDKPSTGMVQSSIKHSWMPTEVLCPQCYRKHCATIPLVYWELAFLTAFVIPMYDIQYKYKNTVWHAFV